MNQQEPERHLDSRSFDDTHLQDEKVQRQKGLRRWWDGAPTALKVLTAFVGLVTAVVGLLGGINRITSASPSASALSIAPSPSTSTPAPKSTVPVHNSGDFPGYVISDPSLQIRAVPRHSGHIVGYLAHDAEVIIVCTTIGDPVTGPRHGGGQITTPVWDKVRTSTSAAAVGFVPDAWINTGRVRPVAPTC